MWVPLPIEVWLPMTSEGTFTVVGSCVWNTLPLGVRLVSTCLLSYSSSKWFFFPVFSRAPGQFSYTLEATGIFHKHALSCMMVPQCLCHLTALYHSRSTDPPLQIMNRIRLQHDQFFLRTVRFCKSIPCLWFSSDEVFQVKFGVSCFLSLREKT